MTFVTPAVVLPGHPLRPSRHTADHYHCDDSGVLAKRIPSYCRSPDVVAPGVDTCARSLPFTQNSAALANLFCGKCSQSATSKRRFSNSSNKHIFSCAFTLRGHDYKHARPGSHQNLIYRKVIFLSYDRFMCIAQSSVNDSAPFGPLIFKRYALQLFF